MYSLCFSLLALLASFHDVISDSSHGNPVFGPTDGHNPTWWQTGVVYQVYPRSFKDTDGNGVGDLQGVIDKLDYLRDLNVQTIWLSPFYKSPMTDFGNDITNFTDVDPLFGDLAVFDRLVRKAHAKGLKVIIDFVPGYTSFQHEWFLKSANKTAPYSDYYLWTDSPLLFGSVIPVNNWMSVYFGTSWVWNRQRKQLYYHTYLSTMSNLDLRNNMVNEEVKNVLRFWLDRGVDGFRAAAVSHIFPSKNYSRYEPWAANVWSYYHYSSIIPIYQENQPDTFPVVASWVDVLKEYERKDGKDRFFVMETYSNSTVRSQFYATGGVPFNLDLTALKSPLTGHDLSKTFTESYSTLPAGKWPVFALGNHDIRRVSERFGADRVDVFNMLLLTVWGTATTFQGEEIGMIPPVYGMYEVVDPVSRAFGEENYKDHSRDYSRSPMQWDNSPFAGFTSGNSTWLKVAQSYPQRNVQDQNQSTKPTSLKLYRQLAKLRKTEPFNTGTIKMAVATDSVFSYIREKGRAKVFVALNIGEQTETNDFHSATGHAWGLVLAATSNSTRSLSEVVSIQTLKLEPGEGLVLRLSNGPVVGK